MKKLLIFLVFVTVTFFGHCDTLDNYHVYLKDSLIGQYDSLSEKSSIALISSELKEDNVVIVRYGTENLCSECVYELTVNIEV